MKPHLVLPFLSLLALPVTAQGARAWAVDSNLDQLFSIDVTTGAATLVGSTAGPLLGTPCGLSWVNATQTLWTLDLATGSLGTLNTTTAAFTAVHTAAPVAGWQGMEWDPSTGRFFLLNQNFNLYSLDPATGLTTLIGATGAPLMTAIDISSTGVLYGIGFSNGVLYTIDKTTGVATAGPTTTPTGMQGLSFGPDGRLYGANTNTDSLYAIDPVTGTTTLIGAHGAGVQFVKGLEVAPMLISPVQVATVEGNGGNNFPFNSTAARRYQQIHSDLGLEGRAITKLSFRGNAGNTTNYTGTYACDMEMLMGSSVAWNQATTSFATTFIGVPTPVFARRVFNIGPIGQNAATGPRPFTVDIPLDAPFAYIGAGSSLAWELRVHSNVLTGNFNAFDIHSAPTAAGTSTITGTGCVATGRTSAMTHTATANDHGGMLFFTSTVTNGPSNAPTVLAIGSTDPNLAFPGVCSNLHTNLLVTINLGPTSATGAFTGDNGFALVFPQNRFGGATLYTQAISIDPGQASPIQVSLSNGRSLLFPMPNTSDVVRVTRLFNNVGGTTATHSFATSSLFGYGLVTQFTY